MKLNKLYLFNSIMMITVLNIVSGLTIYPLFGAIAHIIVAFGIGWYSSSIVKFLGLVDKDAQLIERR